MPKVMLMHWVYDELVEYADIDFGNAALLSPRQGEKKVKFALVLR